MAKAVFFKEKIRKKCEKIQDTVLRFTAQDVRRRAKRSILQGGRVGAKNYKASKPGEPPRSHTGLLKNFIAYAQDSGTYVIGPHINLQVKHSSAKVLEYGGMSQYLTTFAAPKRNIRKCIRKEPHPRLKHSYKDSSGALFENYVWFHSFDTWKNASESPRFQRWARTLVSKRKAIRGYVQMRPYMRPALKVETTYPKILQRYKNAMKTLNKKR